MISIAMGLVGKISVQSKLMQQAEVGVLVEGDGVAERMMGTARMSSLRRTKSP